MKLQETLKSWGGLTLSAITDEDMKDICLAIKYHDHGDEFLFVRTYSGERYTYGYWLDRVTCVSDFSEETNDGRSDRWFLKRPILFRKPDHRCNITNKACFAIGDERMGIHNEYSSMRKCENEKDALRRFNYALNALKGVMTIADIGNIYYRFEHYVDDIVTFAAINNIDKDYVNEATKGKWNSSVNGFDGLAGKKEAGKIIYADGISCVLYRGREFNVRKLRKRTCHYDEWGERTISVNTDQLA